MGLRDFFADLAGLMEIHGVDVSADSDGEGGVWLHFTCEDGTSRDVLYTVNAARARDLAGLGS